ncbi:hypothetical protein KFL_001090010 [Klebsormidium nitens]|uniref:CHCH domain-containing protein n=1 Tax=Klebsormidium nitens TaxID=105231 RepID=A0A1Y1HX47_KLENI|nr:hypothetical protein KFL_001090010 [Klebsormidium nitens]|eukprot:GAQ82352.1 hypothetical protein KFL_001090010 [Klebsormidium nitens]
MSAGGQFGGARGLKPQPPEKGVFPLDHFGECKQHMAAYMACLKEHGSQSEPCRELSKTYLQCRMERNLMAKQDLEELGFREGSNEREQPTSSTETDEKKRTGFIGGLSSVKR